MSSDIPKISIVTPSFNQARYLERTIQSVLEQDYPRLEYIIVDGGSTDGSVEIIRKYSDRLAWWVSEPDGGQASAINKGLQRASGEWVAWQNSDDVFYPGTFESLARAGTRRPDVDLIIGNVNLIDSEDHVLRDLCFVTPTLGAVLAEGMVLTNQAAFWRRGVHRRIGWLNESLHCAFDYDWFLRVLESGRAAHVNRCWGGYRIHEETKTTLINDRCREERASVIGSRGMPRWRVALYQLRRLVLLLAQGRMIYVARGLLQRVYRRSPL